MFNILSLLFGLLAWVLPLLALKGSLQKWAIFSMASFSSSLLALVLQFFEINSRIEIEDFSALMDTIGTLVWVTVILSLITLLLNFVSYLVVSRKV